MKKIDLNKLMINNGYSIKEEMEVLGMEFIKHGNNWLIKNSGGRIVSDKEKRQIERRELIIEDITSNKCQENTTRKLTKMKKKAKKEEIKEEVVIDENIEETELSA